MTKEITQHEGKKYLRTIYSAVDERSIEIDVYDVLDAFNVTCPAVAHCLKKLLAPGQRGKGSVLADLIGAEAALARAIQNQKRRENRERGGDGITPMGSDQTNNNPRSSDR